MSIFYLTNIALDIVLGTTWWVVSNTSTGIYYLMYGNKKGKVSKLKLTDKEVVINRDILEKLLDIENTRQIELVKLTDKIEVLTNYIECHKNKTQYGVNNILPNESEIITINTTGNN